jgi:hypothetical protein
MLVFLTNWCGIIHCYTFFHLLASLKPFTKELLILSWCLGWAVTVLFWAYVYPLTDLEKLPPACLYISSHGGVNLFISIQFFLSDFLVELRDFKWPCIVLVAYFFGMTLPLKIFGVVVYPHFMEKVIPTVLIITGTYICLWICFYIGLLLKSKKDKKVRED